MKIRHVDEGRIWECDGGWRVGTQGRNESFLASLLSLEGKKGRGETESREHPGVISEEERRDFYNKKNEKLQWCPHLFLAFKST